MPFQTLKVLSIYPKPNINKSTCNFINFVNVMSSRSMFNNSETDLKRANRCLSHYVKSMNSTLYKIPKSSELGKKYLDFL